MLDRTTIHLLALSATVAVEMGGMGLWAWLASMPLLRAITSACLVNLLVHTLFWYAQPLFAGELLGIEWPFGLYLAELLVVVGEGALYRRLLTLHSYTPWLLSLLLNAASFMAGLWLWQAIA